VYTTALLHFLFYILDSKKSYYTLNKRLEPMLCKASSPAVPRTQTPTLCANKTVSCTKKRHLCNGALHNFY